MLASSRYVFYNVIVKETVIPEEKENSAWIELVRQGQDSRDCLERKQERCVRLCMETFCRCADGVRAVWTMETM